jgi:DNA-directed RNA polymerase sigma subunit (sigma70/sigma32)
LEWNAISAGGKRHCTERALVNQSKTVRLPVHVVDRLTQMRRADAEMLTRISRIDANDPSSSRLCLTANPRGSALMREDGS